MDWGLFSVVIAVGIPIIGWLRRKYLTRPELTIELVSDGGCSMRRGASNRGIPDEIIGNANNNPIYIFDAENVLFIWEKEWRMKLIIRNNSEYTAYFPKIHYTSNHVGFTRIEPLNEQVPIGSKAEVVLKAEYRELEESTGRNRTFVTGLPPAFNNLKICLEYKNGFKRTYFSIFNNSSKKTEFRRKLSNSYLWKIR